MIEAMPEQFRRGFDSFTAPSSCHKLQEGGDVCLAPIPGTLALARPFS